MGNYGKARVANSRQRGKAIFIKCDVSNEKDVKNLVEKTIQEFGNLHFAINNAGIEGKQAPCQEIESDEWNKVIDINLKGVWLGMKYQIPEILKAKGGAIVNVASIAGHVGFPMLSPYVASKHGVIGLSKSAALENATSNLRINTLCPGVIKTPMIDRAIGDNKEAENAYKQVIPMKRFGTPEEIANTILFLCSDAASYITGQTLTPDGGWVTQ